LVAVLRSAESIAGVTTVVNPDPDRGMGSSLRLGLAECTGDAVVVMLVDTPGIGADAVAAVARRVLPAGAADNTDSAGLESADVAIADFDGYRAPPVAFTRAVWDEVSRLAVGDQGARGFLRAHPELVIAVPCTGDPADIDTLDDLTRWRAGHGGQ
jgi:CTP:molybdopterin cytidylyltransferase MocA